MSRARDKITQAVEAKGAKVTWIEWQPIGQMIEMAGREGGWSVEAEWPNGRSDHAAGYSWQDVVDFIEGYWEQWCPTCEGRGWHTAGGNDPAACNCPAGEAWYSDSAPPRSPRGGR